MQVFKSWLQRGIGVPTDTGMTVREFLQKALGVGAAYVEEKLQTVFLDGRPVDDVDGTLVRPGAVLALSGAMPGLAGATLRRGGYYARMREGITHAGSEPGEAVGGEGIVMVKLFNRPLADLPETLAARPLLVPSDALPDSDPDGGAGEWVWVTVTLA